MSSHHHTYPRGHWLLIILLCSSPFCFGQSLPDGFLNAKAQDGYTTPMGTVFSASGQQLFVWDKAGRVWMSAWNGSQYVKQTTPVLDISDEVGNWRDFGLLSFCLDPNFANNGLVYLFYVVDRHHLFNSGTAAYNPTTNDYYKATISRVARFQFQASGGTLRTVASSRKVLLGETPQTGVPLTHESHAGGTLLFGRDGTLLLSTGDNASYASTDIGSAPETYFQQAITDGIMTANENVGAFRAQMLASHCGKILRLDPNTGNGVSTNPFYDGAAPRSAKSRVWALGFRNPYRMTIQPNTGSTNPDEANPGTLFVGDVGWNTWEDMQVIKLPGENAGWPIYEGQEEQGSYANAAKTLPNKDEPNPTNTCNIPFLRFADLLKQAYNPTTGTSQAINPCSLAPLPGVQRRYFHSRPALDWKHGSAVARIPTFSGNTATATTLSGALGNPFQGNAATAGVYYTGTNFPVAYRNTYFFADYGDNWIKAATFNADGSIKTVREFLPRGGGNGIVDVEYNPIDGSLYYVNINTGEIMKISYGGNQPPVAVASANKQSGTSPLSVTFTGSNSSDPDNDPLTFAWDFGDGTTSALANPTKVFSATGTQGFTVRLTVSDGRGLTDSKTLVISINNAAPTARITAPLSNAKYPLDRESQYTLTAAVTDENPATLQYAWQVSLRHNNHEHREPVLTDKSPTVAISPVGCDGETYLYLIKLTVTDAGGLTATDSVKIYPDCASGSLAVTGATATPGVTSAVVAWTNPMVPFSNVLVVAKAGSGFQSQPTATTYTANASFTGNAAEVEGGKVVYQGPGTSVGVTNLTAGQLYYFRIYTRNGNAWTGGVEVSATPTAPVTPPVTPPTGSTIVFSNTSCYRITSRVSGKVLGIDNGDLNDGGPVRQRSDAGLTWQQWRIKPASDGYYQLEAVHSGKALDVQWGSQSDNAPLYQWGYAEAYSQQWSVKADAEGYYLFGVRNTGKLLHVANNNQTEGGSVVQLTANGTPAQQWSIALATCVNPGTTPPVTPPVTPPTGSTIVFNNTSCYRITSRVSGKVLGVENGGLADGNTIRQRTDAGQTWQQWRVTPTSGGYYQVAAVHSSKALDVSEVSISDNAAVHQWAYVGGQNQQWAVKADADGYYQLVARHSGKLLHVANNNQTEGGSVVQLTANGTPAQQWSIALATCVNPGTTPPVTPPVTPPTGSTIVFNNTSCYRITSRVSGKVVGVESGNLNDGATVRQRTDAGRSWQQWRVLSVGDGYYQLASRAQWQGTGCAVGLAE